MFSKFRFITAVTFAATQIAFAQELPAPAAPEKPKEAPKTAPAKPANGEVKVNTDVPIWLNQPPVRGQNTGEVIIITPDNPPVQMPEKTPSASVGGINVYGLSDLAAYQKIKAAFDPKLKETITLDDGLKKWPVTREQAGVSIPYKDLLLKARRNQGDVPLRYEVDLDAAKTLMRALSTQISDAQTSIDGSAMRLKAAIEGTPSRTTVQLVVLRLPGMNKPDFTDKTAPSGVSKYPYVLAEFSSRYDASLRGRTNNLRMAAKLVDGAVVAPGGTFSTNKTIGPRNAEDGWKEAKMFVSGQIVSGVGSGICQCSSTIYNAALLAGLPIVERHPHMFRVNYVPASRDAAIYWGGKDFRFKNDTGAPIYIETYLKGGHFHARLLSTQPRKGNFAVESRIVSRKKGTLSEAYRIAKNGDEPTKERLSRDYYMPHP